MMGRMTAFDEAIALTRAGDRLELRAPDSWRVGGAVNGGYVAAVMTRALTMAGSEPGRHPCSLTLHYLRPGRPGPAEIHVRVEREGRSLSTVSGRMEQEGAPVVVALAALGGSRPGVDFHHLPMPEAPPPEDVPSVDFGRGQPWFTRNWDYRPCIGPAPYTDGAEALGGGWIRLVEARRLDAPLVAAMTDAWLPSVMPLLPNRDGVPVTVDLTVHFRATLPLPASDQHDFALVVFRSRVGSEGYWEEDGVVWGRDGTVLAQARQLKLFPAL
jgi:acyl-CoA thioesterase